MQCLTETCIYCPLSEVYFIYIVLEAGSLQIYWDIYHFLKYILFMCHFRSWIYVHCQVISFNYTDIFYIFFFILILVTLVGLAKDRNRWRAVVNSVWNLRVP
jgi:hypothetical protein